MISKNKQTRDLVRNRSGAMEMTMGTMVTIVLMVAVLVMVLYFITKIGESGTTAINGIDSAVKAEIDKLFAKDSTKKVVIYPAAREITIKKGDDSLGFGFAIRNTEEEASFSYEITAKETSCDMKLTEAEDLIALGKKGSGIRIPSASIMDDPIFVKFVIPDSAPACKIRYNVDVERDGNIYGSSIGVDLVIESE